MRPLLLLIAVGFLLASTFALRPANQGDSAGSLCRSSSLADWTAFLGTTVQRMPIGSKVLVRPAVGGWILPPSDATRCSAAEQSTSTHAATVAPVTTLQAQQVRWQV